MKTKQYNDLKVTSNLININTGVYLREYYESIEASGYHDLFFQQEDLNGDYQLALAHSIRSMQYLDKATKLAKKLGKTLDNRINLEKDNFFENFNWELCRILK